MAPFSKYGITASFLLGCAFILSSGGVSQAEPRLLSHETKDEWLTVRNLINLELLHLEETDESKKNSAWVLATVVQTGGDTSVADVTFTDSQGRAVVVGSASVAVQKIFSGSIDESEWVSTWTRPEMAKMTAVSRYPFTGAGGLVGGGKVGFLHLSQTANGQQKRIDQALFVPDEWERFALPARDRCVEVASLLRSSPDGDNEKKLINLEHDPNPLVAYAAFRVLAQARRIPPDRLVADYLAGKSGTLLSLTLYTGLRSSKDEDFDHLLEPMRRLVGSQTSLGDLRSVAIGLWLGDGGTGAYIERQVRDGTMPADSRRHIIVADRLAVELHNLLVETYIRLCPARDDHFLNSIVGTKR